MEDRTRVRRGRKGRREGALYIIGKMMRQVKICMLHH